tara:strand:- start:410 stop:727 length:318 start_codon:yes stop_codon:yes gene_type:complete
MNESIINHTFETSKPTKEELQEKFMQMPELEQDYNEETIVKNHAEETHITINDINTFMAHKDELCLRGVNDNGEDITVWFNSYEFLKWIDKNHIKETLTKYINQI